jgi:hypothetical protein
VVASLVLAFAVLLLPTNCGLRRSRPAGEACTPRRFRLWLWLAIPVGFSLVCSAAAFSALMVCGTSVFFVAFKSRRGSCT